MARTKKALFISAAALAFAVAPSAARAGDYTCSAATGYLFPDFGFLGSKHAVFNCETEFDAPFGSTLNVWVQVGQDDISNEIDLTFSHSWEVGPVTLTASGGVYYSPELDNFTITTLDGVASAEVLGF